MTAAHATPLLRLRLPRAVCLGGGLLLVPVCFAQFDPSSSSSQQNDRAPPIVTNPLPIFFPPNPPPLGRLVSRLATSATGVTVAPPPELAHFVTEPFYAPLSTRLIRHTLDEKKRQKLDAYRAARATLLAELQTELAGVRAAAPNDRRTLLAALARRQAPRLVELEATAEQLRVELTSSDNDWSALREWRLGETNPRGDSPAELGAVIRAYAFYQAGFSPEQRLLLREIVIEVTSGSEDATVASAPQPFLFFSPALARVTLPGDLPAEVATKVAAFETKKSALRKELFDTILAQDRATFAFTRAGAFKALAARQAPALAAVEQLADEIRTGLAELPGMNPPEARSPLPPSLTQRTMEIVEARTASQKVTRERIDAITAQVPASYPVIFATTIDAQGVKVRMVPRTGGFRARVMPNDPILVRISTSINEVGEAHRLRQEELNRAVEELRGEVSQVLGPNTSPKAIEDALNAVIRYNVQRENEAGYHDYRLAVFEPGLSPEQRRLLLGGAVRKLDLPLPSGEFQPTRRSPSW